MPRSVFTLVRTPTVLGSAVAGAALALACFFLVTPGQIAFRGFQGPPELIGGERVRWARAYARVDIGGTWWRPVHARVELRVDPRTPEAFRGVMVTADGVPVSAVPLTERWQALEYRGRAASLELRAETGDPEARGVGVGAVTVAVVWSPLRGAAVGLLGALAGAWMALLLRSAKRHEAAGGAESTAGTRVGFANVALALLVVVYLVLLGTERLVFGSAAGNWVYPYARAMAPLPFLAWLLVLPPVLALWRSTAVMVERRPGLTLAVWFVAGFLLSLAARALAPFSLDALVRSGANAFYDVARIYTPGRVLGDFVALTSELPLHAGANMPGKILIYQFLLSVTTSPWVLACIVVALSNVPAVLLYLVLEKMGLPRRVALLALVLAMIVPSKIELLPIFNVASSALILLALWLLVAFMRRGHATLLWLMGATLYATLLVEPVTLSLGLAFLFVIGWGAASRLMTKRRLVKVVLHAAAAFLLVHLAVRQASGFDIVAAFRFVVAGAARFNQDAGRQYGVWVVANLPEFLLSAGVVSSVLAAAALARFAAGGWPGSAKLRSTVARVPGEMFLLGVLTTVVALDLMGVNRGEVTRLWLFLAVALQAGAAVGARRIGRVSWELCIAATLLQGIVTTSMVAFAAP